MPPFQGATLYEKFVAQFGSKKLLNGCKTAIIEHAHRYLIEADF
jgi:hypothetical protein